jgi:IMP dehydrogenase
MLVFLVKIVYICTQLNSTTIAMIAHNTKIIGEGLTYDDVLVPNYSNVPEREVSIKSKFSRNITNVPIVSAAMDTVTESAMAIAMAQEGGIGVLHKT